MKEGGRITTLATGGEGPEGFAPNFPSQKALQQLLPRDPKVAVGARAKHLPLVFAEEHA